MKNKATPAARTTKPSSRAAVPAFTLAKRAAVHAEAVEKISRLTARQREVLQEIWLSHSDKEIGAALGISEKTAGVHVSAILLKMGFKKRQDAVLAFDRALWG